MAHYRIGNKTFSSDDPQLAKLLAGAHTAKGRPLCLCRPPGVEMYVAKISGKYVVKRMPNSGGDHAPACDSYEPPAELSGLGQVMGSAIQENPDEGMTTLKLDFALSKSASRSAPIPNGAETDSVKTDGSKLSLRGTLHYLWEEAGYNKWVPGMQGKRSYYVIRKYLMQAAADKFAKGASLSDILYIPESFSMEKKDNISQRRMAQMGKIATTHKGTRRLMLLVGDVKEIAQSRYGFKIILKHLPDCAFMVPLDLHQRLVKRFEMELGLWDAIEDSHLIVIGTFCVGSTGIPSLEEVALMTVTDNWIPFETTFDKILIDAMTAKHRRFVKGMRYNLASYSPLACVVASDTPAQPTAMYIAPPGCGEEYTTALNALVEESKLASWTWRAGEADMPALPLAGSAR